MKCCTQAAKSHSNEDPKNFMSGEGSFTATPKNHSPNFLKYYSYLENFDFFFIILFETNLKEKTKLVWMNNSNILKLPINLRLLIINEENTVLVCDSP